MTPPDRLTRDILLDPDALLRISAVPDARGTLLELRVHRASPADRSEERFRPTGEAIEIPLVALKRFKLELAGVIQAVLDCEFRRPWPGRDALPHAEGRPHATD